MGKRRLPLAVFGMQRSGSTLLCGLLTHGVQQMLCEPRLFRPERRRKYRKLISESQRLGIKEVNPVRIEASLRYFRVAKILMPVRDVRDIALSKYEWIKDEKARWSLDRQPNQIQLIAQWCEQWIKAPSVPTMVVPYERLVTDPAFRKEIEEWTGWTLEGDPAGSIPRRSRTYEIIKHRGVLTSQSVDRYQQEPEEGRREFADKVARMCRGYQEAFGYGSGTNQHVVVLPTDGVDRG